MATLTNENPLTKAYDKLSPSEQSQLKAFFMSEYGYKSPDTFYKKMRGDTSFSPAEKKFLGEKLRMSVKKLFPEKQSTK